MDTEKLAPISCANAEAEEGYREQNKNTTREDNDMPAVYLTGAYHCHLGGRSMRSTILFIIPVKRNPWNSSSGSTQNVWR